MTDYANDRAWKEKLNQTVLRFYLDNGAPARFYIQDCVPAGMLDYIEPGLRGKYGDIALYVNTGSDTALHPANRDFVLFTAGGIFTSSAAAKNFREWGKLADYYAAHKAADAAPETCQNLIGQMTKLIAPTLTGKCADLGAAMSALVRRALQMLVGLAALPPSRLPYLPLPPQSEASKQPAAPALPAPAAADSPEGESAAAAADNNYEVDF